MTGRRLREETEVPREAPSEPSGLGGLEELAESPIVNGTATKLRVLRELQERQMTAPEVARALQMDRAGIYRHLESLWNYGLVERLESERKWVYYALTKRGRTLLTLGSGLTLAVILIGGASMCAYFIAQYLTARPAGGEGGLVDPVAPPSEPNLPFLALGISIAVTIVLALVNRFISQRWIPWRSSDSHG